MKRNFSDEDRAKLVTTRDDAYDGLLRAETSHEHAKEWHQQVTGRYAEQITEQDRDRVRPELAESADRLRGAQDTLRDATKQYDNAENTLSAFDRDRRSQTVDDYLVGGGTEAAKIAGKAAIEQHVGVQLPDLPPELAAQAKYQADRIVNEQIKPWAEDNLKVSSGETLDRLAQQTSGSLDTEQNRVLRDIEREVPTSGDLEAPAFPKPSDNTVPASPGEPESSRSRLKFAPMPLPQDDVPQPKQGSGTSKDAPAVPQPNEATVEQSSQPLSSQSVSKFTNVPPPSDTVPAASSPAPEGPSASKFTHVPQM